MDLGEIFSQQHLADGVDRGFCALLMPSEMLESNLALLY